MPPIPRLRLPPPPAPALRLALAAALAASALPRTSVAQPPRHAAHEAHPGAAGRDQPSGPFWLSLLTAVGAGVAGAAAAERIAGPRGAAAPASALENLVVGSVGAVALLGINPPDGAWVALAGTAAAGGVAGQALLLASAHARRAAAAEVARDAADEGARRTAVLAGEQMETLRRLALDAGGMIGGGSAPDEAWARALDVYAERARVELVHVARREAPPARATHRAAHTPEPAL